MARRKSLIEALRTELPRSSQRLPARTIRREVNKSQNKTEFTVGIAKEVLRREGLIDQDDEWVPPEGVIATPEKFVTDEEIVLAFRLPRPDVVQDRREELPDTLSIDDLERDRLYAD